MSRIRANTITNKAATGAPTFSNGAVVTGVCTATSFAGSGAALTGISAGLFSSYAIITHEKSNNTHGSSLSNSSYATRELNTEVADPDNIVSVSGNHFTLQAGSYLIESMSIIHRGNQSQSRLYNVTDSSVDGVGMAVMTSSSFASQTVSTLVNRITISGAKAFEIQHQCQTSHSTYGLGLHHGISGANSIYTIVEIYKES